MDILYGVFLATGKNEGEGVILCLNGGAADLKFCSTLNVASFINPLLTLLWALAPKRPSKRPQKPPDSKLLPSKMRAVHKYWWILPLKNLYLNHRRSRNYINV